MSIGQGRIIKTYNGYYYVDSGTDELVTCKVKGKLKQIRFSLCTGDIVEFETNHNGESMITRILPRRNFMLRPTIANVDLIIVAFACINPDFSYLLADKLLVVAAMLLFVEQHRMPAWALLLVVAREFAVTGLRLIAVDNGRVIAAAWSGKIKTASTMVAICLMLLWDISWLNTVCWVVIVVTTVYSGVEYFVKNHDVFRKAA